ncbi:MAG: C10 family peptidase, partial [Bacteroidales bacterium]|nr:C10 family peptidase [Bacteroidales bacterium]
MKSQIFYRFFALCLLLSGLLQMTVVAGEVTKVQAVTVAKIAVNQYFPVEKRSLYSNVSISGTVSSDEPFYICNVGDSGFVIVAKNENCPPVLGFSWESKFPATQSEIPALMNVVLSNIRNQCENLQAQEVTSPDIQENWQVFSGKKSGLSLTTGAIAPLLTTSWNCSADFFNMYPQDYKAGGSVAIAMAQIFRFYETPSTGNGELCYVLNGYGELCTKFDDVRFNFKHMSDVTGTPAVDSLVYYMAVACQMQPEGAALEAYKTTLPAYFGYSKNMRTVESWDYNVEEVIHHQLTLRHPVPADWLYQSFVIDGYFPGNLFHFNMGLGGLYNGFYQLDYPVVKVDTDHTFLNCYTDFHPESMLPGPTNVSATLEGESIRISWEANLGDSLSSLLKRFVVLQDGLIPIAETTEKSVLVPADQMGISSNLRVVADFGVNGSSELSEPFRYISNQEIADIPSIALRRLINTQLGTDNLLRQPFVGELELIRSLEIGFADQRGIEILPQLKNLRIDGTDIRVLRDGDYLQRLRHLRFYDCYDFDFTKFGQTRSLIELYGYNYLPFDLYEFRHNTDMGMLRMSSTGTYQNMLMDLYGADRYFPKLAECFLFHLGEGFGASYKDCFVSYETWNDVIPKIKASTDLLIHTKPSVYAPCYPTPARDVNIPSVTRLSWESNLQNQPDVYYNVFVGNSRNVMDLVSIFQTDKFYNGTFEQDKDYYWRVEAYHADTTYYSGLYHFSTYQDLPIPFTDNFDGYYTSCPVADASPFWVNINTTLTKKAIANRSITYSGFYSMELKPKSDAGLLIKTPDDPAYFVEFRFKNQGGQVAAELLQKSSTSDDNIVNSKIELMGAGVGLLTYGEGTFAFSFVPEQWNRINVSMNMTTGVASLMVNEEMVKEWDWNVQIGGTNNTNPFKGIRFVNNAAAEGGSGFIDNLIIDLKNPASTVPVINPDMNLVYLMASREVVLKDVQPNEIQEISLYDIKGRKIVYLQYPENLIFPIGPSVAKGIYVVVVSRKDGRKLS